MAGPTGSSGRQEPRTYAEFWIFYLREHSRPATRALHLAGTGLGLILLAAAMVKGSGWLLTAAVVSGYAFAWTGHVAVEGNRPATLRHPLWSLASDFRMFFLWCAGRLVRELTRAGVE